MKIAFTICSNNYLAQAKTLGDSLIRINSGYNFFIILVDGFSKEIDYSFFIPHKIVPVSDIGIYDFDSLWKKYNIIELNTSVKASAFKYLFNTYPDSDFVFYFDPDIQIFYFLNDLENEFESSDILLTPHIITPIPLDDEEPQESRFLNYGIYNLGFIGLKSKSLTTQNFLNWWESRTLKFGFINEQKGFFVDQLWVNLVPIFFGNVKILMQYGYNAGPWNLHERKNINKVDNKYIMSDGSILAFYHFSVYQFSNPGNLARNYSRYNFRNCPDLKQIYDEYRLLIVQNKIEMFSQIECYYSEARQNFVIEEFRKHDSFKRRFKRKINKVVKLLLPPILTKMTKIFTGKKTENQ